MMNNKKRKSLNKNIKLKKSNEKGITLIALVVTIIILIILAGVGINLVLGDNGIITKANTAQKETYKTSAKERAMIDILAWQSDKLEKNENADLNDKIIQEILDKKDYVKEGKAGEKSFITAEGEYEIPYSELYQKSEEPFVYNPETLEIGEAINSEKYGWKVNGYKVTTSEFTTGVWRLFYQDSNYTYLITDECVGSYKPFYYCYSTYLNGSYVSTIGQRLNKMLLDSGTIFVESNTNDNMIHSTAWLTDPEMSYWTKYKNEDTVFAIGSPTLELYVASFNATSGLNKAEKIILGVEGYGYTYDKSSNQLQISYNKGIYNKSTSSSWWLASPDESSGVGIVVDGERSSLSGHGVALSNAIRPIVCIPTSVFNSKYLETMINE